MFIWLLRLFPEYRALRDPLESEITNLRDTNNELVTEKRILEAQIEGLQGDKDRLWDLMKESLDAERLALHTQVNHATQRLGGGIPYPDAHSIPAASVPAPQSGGPVGRRGRLLPSQAAHAVSMRFIQNELMNQSGVIADQEGG